MHENNILVPSKCSFHLRHWCLITKQLIFHCQVANSYFLSIIMAPTSNRKCFIEALLNSDPKYNKCFFVIITLLSWPELWLVFLWLKIILISYLFACMEKPRVEHCFTVNNVIVTSNSKRRKLRWKKNL
jgi:hypothetical protein